MPHISTIAEDELMIDLFFTNTDATGSLLIFKLIDLTQHVLGFLFAGEVFHKSGQPWPHIIR